MQYRTAIYGLRHSIVDVCEAGTNSLQLQACLQAYGAVFDDVWWFAYTCDGKMCLGTLEHMHGDVGPALDAALKAFDEEDGKTRAALCCFHDTHYWQDEAGVVRLLTENDEETIVFQYDTATKTLTPGPNYAQYEIAPDQIERIIEAVRDGHVLSCRKLDPLLETVVSPKQP